jgi:hypothetical protein
MFLGYTGKNIVESNRTQISIIWYMPFASWMKKTALSV